MADSGGTTREEQDRLRRRAERARQYLEDRAAGRKRWSGAGAALRWMVEVHHRRSAARGICYSGDGSSGFRSLAAVEQTQAALAAVYAAVKDAKEDDRERNPERPAPVEGWIRMAFLGSARVRGYSNGQIAEHSRGWSELEVKARMARVLRVVRDHLRAGGWLTGGSNDEE